MNLQLDAGDLDALEHAVRSRTLPPTTGFFFGQPMVPSTTMTSPSSFAPARRSPGARPSTTPRGGRPTGPDKASSAPAGGPFLISYVFASLSRGGARPCDDDRRADKADRDAS